MVESLKWSGLGWEGGGGNSVTKLSEAFVLRPWTCPGPPAPQDARGAQRQAGTWLGFVSGGSVALSWGPGLVGKAAEGSSGNLSLLLAPALPPSPVGT